MKLKIMLKLKLKMNLNEVEHEAEGEVEDEVKVDDEVEDAVDQLLTELDQTKLNWAVTQLKSNLVDTKFVCYGHGSSQQKLKQG